jgi:hypothetical protein
MTLWVYIYNRKYLLLSYPIYVRLKTKDKKSQGVKDFFLVMGKYMLCKGMFKPERFMCHSVCVNNFFFLFSRLHSTTQAGCGSKRLTNMYTPTLHKYQTSKYLQRKRKLYIRTANVVIVLLFNYCQKIVLVESTEFTVCQAFAPVVRIGSPPPRPLASVVPPLDPGGGHTRLRE